MKTECRIAVKKPFELIIKFDLQLLSNQLCKIGFELKC